MKLSQNRYINFLWWRYLMIKIRVMGHIGKHYVPVRFSQNFKGKKHNLPSELIISLASYPPRFADLHLTLMTLLDQRVKADRVVLYIPDEYVAQLPKTVTDLQSRGLEILTGPNIRSYGKLVPIVKKYPDAFIVTADDDVYYGHDWLEELVECWPGGQTIVAHNGHWVQLKPDNRMEKAETWPSIWEESDQQKKFFMPIGEGGILYPPRSLHPDVLDDKVFLDIVRETDDFWFFWMALRVGSSYVPTRKFRLTVTWPSSQAAGLSNRENLDDFNDIKLALLYDRYGWPPAQS